MKNLRLLKGIALLFAVSLFTVNVQAQGLNQAEKLKKAQDTKRFARAVNTGSNHTLLILDKAWGETKPEVGDEIAVYDPQGNMVASIVYVGDHTGLALWGDDEYTEEKEGLSKGEKFHLKWWKKSTNEMISLTVSDFERGNDFYNKDGLTVIADLTVDQILEQSIELFQNVPNPVLDFTEISFYLPKSGKVHLSLHNNLGQEILVLTNTKYEAGSHNIEMNTTIAPGVYFYKLVSGKEKITKQMTVIK